jgi:omega-6 fatty acid desaturase (delta-12 desaturase)
MSPSHVSLGSLIVKRDFLHNGRSHHQLLPLIQRGKLQAAVLPVTPPLLDDEAKRKQMSEEYGFKQIGEQLPDNVTLKDVMDTLPKEVPTMKCQYKLCCGCSYNNVLM